jgi:hypothetical protein
MNRSVDLLTTVIGAAVLLCSSAAHAQVYDLSWFTFGGGGGELDASGFQLGGTVGQADTIVMTGGGIELVGGFWSGVEAGPCGSADFNCDGDLGTDADIEAFFACLAGSCPPPPCSGSADFNGDGDVGTDADIEAFFRVLAGGACS